LFLFEKNYFLSLKEDFLTFIGSGLGGNLAPNPASAVSSDSQLGGDGGGCARGLRSGDGEPGSEDSEGESLFSSVGPWFLL
jgi:hypothetical protein